ncbi:MAG: EscU/YscU/HrcU family type III secretion system export apparatus switch protein [Clostridiales bacterium]|nr:EscU/YscU/HrcU family type III secretion system export apparatus switch protein [Clostridiales bacterium]
MEENKKNRASQKAIALKYSPTDIAPKVIAKGQGFMAERILKTAEENDVAVYKDEKLVSELDKLDIGNNIPPELYEVVAQVLIFIDRLDQLAGYKNR